MMTERLRKYGKSSGDVAALKADMLTADAAHLARHDKIAALYAAQPARTACKTCGAPLDPDAPDDFSSHGIGYRFCPACGHLNGRHDDTETFARALYVDDAMGYATPYRAPDDDAFARRLDLIYRPKAAFLREALDAAGLEDARDVVDIGAGCGYFVKALRDAGFAAHGLESDAVQVADANRFVGADAVRLTDLSDAATAARETEASVVTLIGVLEHVRHPNAILEAAAANPAVKAVFALVPMAGAATYLELLFPASFNRHLGGGHTHLYTEESIDWLCRRHGFARAGEWWFGSDAMDLRRHGLVALSRRGVSARTREHFDTMMRGAMDAMQLAFDHQRASGDIHMLLVKTG